MKRTVQGRIVYDRKKHEFEPRDVVRILQALTLADYTGDFGSFRALLTVYFQTWRLIVDGLLVMMVRYPEESGNVILEIMAQFLGALLDLTKAAPARIKLIILEGISYILLKRD